MVTERRTEPKEVRQEQILTAARKVFREKGYDGATVSDIVREAGVAQGTFYLYFPSKKEAFFALAQQCVEIIRQAVMGAYNPSMSFEDRIRAMTKAAFECSRQNADLVRLINFGAESVSIEVQAQALKDNSVISAVSEMFRRDMEAGTIRTVDPGIAARALYGMVKSAVLEAVVLGSERDAKRLEKGVADLVIHALRKRS